MLLQMERDNLTDALNEWKTNGDSRLDLAAPTLYKDFVSGALTSNSLMDSMTKLVQMVQGDSINIVFGFRYISPTQYLDILYICLKFFRTFPPKSQTLRPGW